MRNALERFWSPSEKVWPARDAEIWLASPVFSLHGSMLGLGSQWSWGEGRERKFIQASVIRMYQKTQERARSKKKEMKL